MVSAHITNATIPARASKKFAGGFGGVGSTYTHSHLTAVRKQSTSVHATPGRTRAVPMKITAGKNHINDYLRSHFGHFPLHNSAARARSPCSSIDVSGSDLRMAGNLSGLPEYLLDKHGHNTNYFNRRGGSVNRGDHMVSKDDTSRSPIPIDEESLEKMNRHLPTKMNNEFDHSRSNIPSDEPSTSRSALDKNRAEKRETNQKQPFIMSPRNLAETLRKQ